MKYALVTGSGRGIGKAIADKLETDGYMVFRNGREQRECSHYIRADLSNPDGAEALAEEILSRIDTLDCLVLNAGITCRKSFREITPEDWQQVLDVNLNMPFFLVQKLAGHMAEESSILFISSVLSIYPHATSLPYGVSKAAVNMLARGLVKELAPGKVRVNAICPGFINTEWQKEKPLWLKEKIAGKTAVKRFGTPEEVADACLSLVKNTYINGAVVTVDGGYNME